MIFRNICSQPVVSSVQNARTSSPVRSTRKGKPAHSARRATTDKGDVRRASKASSSSRALDSLRRSHSQRSAASIDRPESACSHGSTYSDSSYSTLQSESTLADYYSVESLSSFDSGVDSLDSMLWLGGESMLSPTLSPADLPSSRGPPSEAEFAGRFDGQQNSDAGAADASADIPLPPGWLMRTTADGKP